MRGRITNTLDSFKIIMKFYSWADAEKIFEGEMGVLSDDSDREEARFMRWMEDEGHHVVEDDPYKDLVEVPQKHLLNFNC